MKKNFFIPILLILCFSLVFATPEVTVSSVSVSDANINIGDSGSLSFTVTNTGDRDLTSINIVLSSSISLAQTNFNFNDIQIGESRFVTTSYSAPQSLSSGSYGISISVDYNVGDNEYSNQAGTVITVIGSNFLVVSEYTSNLIIDQSTPFSINVTNEGDDILYDVLLDLVLPDGFIPTSGSQFYVSSLNPSESYLLSTNIFIEKSIEPDSFQFTLSKTADGYSDSDTLNIIVTGEPTLSFSGINLDPEIPLAGTAQTISVQFENIGSGKAYNVVAQLIFDQEVTGTTIEYLGTLDREDLTSAIFDIQTPLVSSLSGTVVVDYIDANGVQSTISQSIDFDVIAKNGTSTTNYLLWGAVIIIVGYFSYKKFIKKK